jgi:hypothetical protein
MAGQATEVAAVLVTGFGDPFRELPVVLHVPVGWVGVIDVGVCVAAGRVPDGQQVAGDGELVPGLVDGEVGLSDAELFQLGHRVVVEEPAVRGVAIDQLEELPAGGDRRVSATVRSFATYQPSAVTWYFAR